MKRTSSPVRNKRISVRGYRIPLIILTLFAVTGVTLSLLTQAETLSIDTEPEAGQITAPATIISDSTASGTKAIQFAAAPTPPPPPPTGPVTYTVVYTDNGYDPATSNLKLGDTVIFKNSSTKAMWPASDQHPTHRDYSAFDALKEYAPGTTWSFTFDKAGTFYYHDHLQPGRTGIVVVQ